MTYQEGYHGERQAYATSIALVAAQDAVPPFKKPYVVLLLDFEEERPNAAWQGPPSCARQLAAALLNAADRAEEGL